jgi:hypothetical protein
MKKPLLMAFFAVATTVASAQMSNQEITSIKPADGTPAYFTTQEELDAKKQDKIAKLKTLIIEAAGDKEKQTYLRQELWRMENATVRTANPKN